MQDRSNAVEQTSSSAARSVSNSEEIQPFVRMFDPIWINRVSSEIVFAVLQL